MSQGDQQNPYVSPQADVDAVVSGRDLESKASRRGAGNISGLILTILGTAVFTLASPKFQRIYGEFKLSLPMITTLTLNASFICGLGALFCGWFVIGLIVKTKQRSSAIGISGLVCLILVGLGLVFALFQPLLFVMTSLTQ